MRPPLWCDAIVTRKVGVNASDGCMIPLSSGRVGVAGDCGVMPLAHGRSV
jgi:hypothetical protein